MVNLSLNFEYPWLLLLLIPTIALALFMHFRLQKRYRRNRNRITSLVLHLIATVLTICVLAGITISYDKPNKENEVIILVDVSDSNTASMAKKEQFVKDVIDTSSEMFKVGVVKFGFDQVFTSESGRLSNDPTEIWTDYINSPNPNTSATNIAGALNYARTLFTSPETAKIVLVTDGIETDGNAVSTVKGVAADGIIVDTVYFPTNWGADVQLIGTTLPDYNVLAGDPFNLTLNVQSSYVGEGKVKITDTDENGNSIETTFDVSFIDDINEIPLSHKLANPGLHKLRFELFDVSGDTLSQNNVYYSYMYLEDFDKILMIERYEGESEELKKLLEHEDNGGYTVTTVNALDTENMPATLDILRNYEQVILFNVANEDLPLDFDIILNEYVHEIGGGLFTVGGNMQDENGNHITNNYGEVVNNAYNREDMRGTLLQDMLPVKAIDYSPPVAVMIIIDCSGSMEAVSSTGETKLELAKKGAKSCLEALTERDYAGVMTFDDEYSDEIAITPLTQKSKISSAIDEISGGGGTIFTGALDRAGLALGALTSVERRHIILVTDAEPGDSFETYTSVIKRNYDTHGITFSMVAIEYGANNYSEMEAACEYGHGRFHNVRDASDLPDEMRADINVKEIKAYNPEPFAPKINGVSPITENISQEEMPELNGFYGTQLKDGAEAPLTTDFSPIYAQWKYGEGTVGSFMCDLTGTKPGSWSSGFMTSTIGQRIIANIIVGLFPTEDIKAKDIELQFKDDNYTTQMSVYTDMEDDNVIGVTVTSPPEEGSDVEGMQMINPGVNDDYSRIKFYMMQAGVHEVLVEKKQVVNGEETVISNVIEYKAFSYSKEYNAFVDSETVLKFITDVTAGGRGTIVAVDDVWDIFDDFEPYIHIVVDPRVVFIIISLVCFLLDIAVRKFKFKWPHEIIRDRKAKKELALKGKK